MFHIIFFVILQSIQLFKYHFSPRFICSWIICSTFISCLLNFIFVLVYVIISIYCLLSNLCSFQILHRFYFDHPIQSSIIFAPQSLPLSFHFHYIIPFCHISISYHILFPFPIIILFPFHLILIKPISVFHFISFNFIPSFRLPPIPYFHICLHELLSIKVSFLSILFHIL